MKNNENKFMPYTTIDTYKTFFNFFILLLLFNVFLYILQGVSGYTFTELSEFKWYEIITMLLSPLIFCILFFWQSRNHKGYICQNLGLRKKFNFKHLALAIGTSIFSLIFFSQIVTLFDNALSLIGFNPTDTIEMNSIGDLLLNVVLLAMLPAIFEELVFRGIIFNGLKDKHSAYNAILISALFFTLMHGSLQQTFYQFILGIILALLMYITENIIYPIITHFTSNFIILILAYITQPIIETEILFTFWNIFIPILLALIGLILTIIIFKILNKDRPKWENNLKFKYYTLEEKKYAVGSVLIAVLLWFFNTVTIFLQG